MRVFFNHIQEGSIFPSKRGVELLLAVGAYFGLQPVQAHCAGCVKIGAHHHGAPFLGVEQFIADFAGKLLWLPELNTL